MSYFDDHHTEPDHAPRYLDPNPGWMRRATWLAALLAAGGIASYLAALLGC